MICIRIQCSHLKHSVCSPASLVANCDHVCQTLKCLIVSFHGPAHLRTFCFALCKCAYISREARPRRNVCWSRPSVSACLSLTVFIHYCTDPDVTWECYGVPSSCALLGRFAIGARFSCSDNITPNAKCQRVLVLFIIIHLFTLCMSGYYFFYCYIHYQPNPSSY